MKTRLNILPAIASALIAAVIIFGLFPATAVATGSHYERSGKTWSKKAWTNKGWFEQSESKKKRHGKKCQKKDCDNSLSIPLYVKGEKRVGKVTLRLEGGDLKVSYQMIDGWFIKQTNLNVSDNYNDLVKADGLPDLEAYPYKSKHFTPVQSADHTISASQWALGLDLYFAVQATVINKTHGKCEQYSAKSRHSNSHDDSDHKKYQRKKSDKKGHPDHEDYFKKGSRDHQYIRSGHDNDKNHENDHHKHYNHKHQSNSKEMNAWALGEKFPNQEVAGYFIYKLESCDTVEQSTIQFSDAIYTVNEGEQQALITVVRSGNLAQASSIEFTTLDVEEGALGGADYEFTSGVLSFEPGQTSAQFPVTLIDDTEVETVETLQLQLSNPLGATLGQQKMATLEIEDNDEVSEAVIAINRIEPNPANEGDTVIIYVTRTGDLSVNATVEFGTLDGTAIGATQCGAPATPVPFDYQQVGGTLFFDAGITELTIEVTTCNNNPRGDIDETFDIEIYNPMGAILSDDGDGNPYSNLETITIMEGS